MPTKYETCPECGKQIGVPLIWGKLKADAAEKVARRELVSGGCDIWSAFGGVVMNRECLACGPQWKEAEYKPTRLAWVFDEALLS